MSFLEGRQDPGTGGLGNVDSTAWAVSGLNGCGFDAGSPRFATSTGRTPQDALLAGQLPAGDPNGGAWTFGGTANLYSTVKRLVARRRVRPGRYTLRLTRRGRSTCVAVTIR